MEDGRSRDEGVGVGNGSNLSGAAIWMAGLWRLPPTALGRMCEFSPVPVSCRSPRLQFLPKTALWQHVVGVLPARSGPSKKFSKAAIESFRVYASRFI